MRRLRPEQDDDAMDRDVIVRVQQRVVDQDVGVLPRRSAGLEIEMDDLFQRIPQADDEIGRRRDGGQIDVEQGDDAGRRPVKRGEEVGRAVTTEVLQRGIEGQGHGGESRLVSESQAMVRERRR